MVGLTNQTMKRNDGLKSIRESADTITPQTRHHFRLLDQVNALVGAREADPDLVSWRG